MAIVIIVIIVARGTHIGQQSAAVFLRPVQSSSLARFIRMVRLTRLVRLLRTLRFEIFYELKIMVMGVSCLEATHELHGSLGWISCACLIRGGEWLEGFVLGHDLTSGRLEKVLLWVVTILFRRMIFPCYLMSRWPNVTFCWLLCRTIPRSLYT